MELGDGAIHLVCVGCGEEILARWRVSILVIKDHLDVITPERVFRERNFSTRHDDNLTALVDRRGTTFIDRNAYTIPVLYLLVRRGPR